MATTSPGGATTITNNVVTPITPGGVNSIFDLQPPTTAPTVVSKGRVSRTAKKTSPTDPVSILLRKDPHAKQILGSSYGDKLVTGTANVSRSAYVHSKRYQNFISQNIGGTFNNLNTAVGDVSTALTGTLTEYSSQIRKNLEPISDFMGSTLGTLTGVLRDPLGPNGLGNIATNLLNNIAPGFGDKVNGTIINLGLENLVNLPSQIYSSLQHLAATIDSLLAVPLSILAEVYYGCIAIMESIGKLLQNLINSFIDFILDWLDAIIPFREILALLEAASVLANQIGTISSVFLGAGNSITGFTNQVINFGNQIGGFINNPANLLVSLVPPQINQFINYFTQPQNLINKILPPELSSAFAGISKLTGVGFNGNMGYGFESVLKAAQGGIVSTLLKNFAAQYSILGPLLAGGGNNNPAYQQTGAGSAQGYPAVLEEGKYTKGYTDETVRQNQSQYAQAQPFSRAAFITGAVGPSSSTSTATSTQTISNDILTTEASAPGGNNSNNT